MKKNNQATDIAFPRGITDSISCLAVNGSQTAPTTIVAAGSWDSNVRYFIYSINCGPLTVSLCCLQLHIFEVQYSHTGQALSASHRGCLTHPAPILCADFAPVRLGIIVFVF